MAWIRFEEVKVKGVRRWTDSDGKKRQETKTFSQTINPFNKNACGLPKTCSEIVEEITAERDAWMAANRS